MTEAAAAEHAADGGTALPAPLPTGEDVRALLNGLFDRAVTVHDEPAPVLRGRDVVGVATYVDDQGRIGALALCDLAVGCSLGAALALVPAPRVEEAVAAGRVPPELADNTREVLNIAASLFNGGPAHLKLRDMWVAPEPVGDDAVALLRRGLRRADLRVAVPGYGTGQLVLLLADA